jgi:hypothetical protein
MKHFNLLFIVVALFFINISSANSQSNTTITVKDFTPVLGSGWQGNLVYFDNAGKEVTVTALLTVTQLNETSIALSISFPQLSDSTADTVDITNGGTYLDDKKILSVEKSGDVTTVVSQNNGIQKSRAATFRYTYILSPTQFVVNKELQYEGSSEFTLDNKYMFTRQ